MPALFLVRSNSEEVMKNKKTSRKARFNFFTVNPRCMPLLRRR